MNEVYSEYKQSTYDKEKTSIVSFILLNVVLFFTLEKVGQWLTLWINGNWIFIFWRY